MSAGTFCFALNLAVYVWMIVAESGKETATISSSCNDQTKTGLYYLKPTEHGPVIPAICHEGYTMIDPSLNFDEYSEYFTSLYRYGDDDRAQYGTDCSDFGGWRDWFIPANEQTKFRVAVGCTECAEGAIYGDNTAYYMTTGYLCPILSDGTGCSISEGTLLEKAQQDPLCNVCDDTKGLCGEGSGREATANGNWCDCYTLQLSADAQTSSTHDTYCQGGITWRPNFVVDRSQCTCYQPADSEQTTYTVGVDELPLVSTEFKHVFDIEYAWYIDDLIQWEEDEEEETAKTCHEKVTYISSDDFKSGTYRIAECGNYVLTEDIVVNFNKPAEPFVYDNGDSPNAYNMDDLPWFPTTAQQESGEYFGLNDFWGPYSLGFSAAITIETEHVYINLNGYSISMDPEFYLQQRFFALILLGNKPFEARQGPVDFGRDDIKIKDIEIKDGKLGLSSHHGIMGAFASDLKIHDLQIMHFDTHGIQCNGCFRINMENLQIGPQNTNIPVMGRYTHARSMLARLRYMVDEYGDQTLRFANRKEETTLQEMADKLVEQMDMVYYHVTQGIEFDDNDEQWIAAKKTFINENGWLDGASCYGIVLIGEGTAVVNIGRRLSNTYDVTMKNIEISGLRAQPRESFWAATGGDSPEIAHGFFFETLDWHYGDLYDEKTRTYIGDIYTDLLFAANTFMIDEFCPLGSMFYLDALSDWAFVDDTPFEIGYGEGQINFRCGSDIQSHSGKGVMGIRMDGTQNFLVENVHIHDLVNWGDLGSGICGEYEEIAFAEGFDVDKDIQYGYTGNNVHGILTDYASGIVRDVRIEHLHSFTGSTIAIAHYKGTQSELDGEIQIDHLVAGQKIKASKVRGLFLPNSSPFVCSVFIGPNSDAETSPEVTPIVAATDAASVIVGDQIYGYDYCADENTRIGDMIKPLASESFVDVNDGMEMNVIDSSLMYRSENVHSIASFIVLTAAVMLAFVITRLVCCGRVAKQTRPSQYGSV